MERQEKKEFREKMKRRRDEIPVQERKAADEKRNERILSWRRYREAELLLFYVSCRSEADTLYLIQKAMEEGRRVAVPKVEGTEMKFYRITSFSQLCEGYRGILEPDAQTAEAVRWEEYPEEKVLLFVPGCAFDKTGGRMGYGGGFYDRFTEAHPKFYRAAPAFAAQLAEKVPCEAHDKKVQCIITEEEIIEVKEAAEKETIEAGEAIKEDKEAETYGARAEKAMELFLEGYNCTQAVVLAFADYYEESPETLATMVSSFGGGMGRLREVCGAVSGMFFVAGRLYGYSDPKAKERKAELYARIQELAGRFREKNGAIVCRELLGLKEKVSVPVPEERTKEYYKKRPCPRIIGDAAEILDQYISDNPPRKN